MIRQALIAVAAAAAMASTLALAQPGPGGPGAGPGPGAGAGPGAGSGAGPGPRGRGMRFGAGNTPGWSLMTPDERNAHRDRMRAAKSVDECRSIQADQRKAMEARAKEKGAAAPRGPRFDMCERMQQRGFFGQAPQK